MKLTLSERKIILSALFSASQWEESIVEVYMDCGHPQRKPIKGAAGIVRKSQKLSRRYLELYEKLEKEIRT